MIDVICRVRYHELFERMVKSAKQTALGQIGFLAEYDKVDIPNLAQTYNCLGLESRADILVFCHDDVVYLTPGWDAEVRKALGNYDIVGVVGATKYGGGGLFNLGHPYIVGKYLCHIAGKPFVKILSPHSSGPVVAVDGFWMAVRRKHFEREKFDPQFDQLYFYDIDYCYRGRCGIVDILLGHYKPADLVGKYPIGMKNMQDYTDKLYKKHNIEVVRDPGDDTCLKVSLETFARDGQAKVFEQFFPKRGLINA